MAATGQFKEPGTGEWSLRVYSASTADWPTRWPSRSEHMPEPPDRWIPERTGSAVIVCARGSRCGNPSQIIDWGSAEDAELADRLLYGEPCDKGCVGNHVRVWTEPGRLHVAKSVHDPPPPSLADELAECYPRLVNGRPIQPGAPTLSATPACWGALSILNMPLEPMRRAPMNPETRRAQDAAVDAACQKLTPEPGGLDARAVRAHHDAEALKRNGAEVDELIGAEQLAVALTNAALCESEVGAGRLLADPTPFVAPRPVQPPARGIRARA